MIDPWRIELHRDEPVPVSWLEGGFAERVRATVRRPRRTLFRRRLRYSGTRYVEMTQEHDADQFAVRNAVNFVPVDRTYMIYDPNGETGRWDNWSHKHHQTLDLEAGRAEYVGTVDR